MRFRSQVLLSTNNQLEKNNNNFQINNSNFEIPSQNLYHQNLNVSHQQNKRNIIYISERQISKMSKAKIIQQILICIFFLGNQSNQKTRLLIIKKYHEGGYRKLWQLLIGDLKEANPDIVSFELEKQQNNEHYFFTIEKKKDDLKKYVPYRIGDTLYTIERLGNNLFVKPFQKNTLYQKIMSQFYKKVATRVEGDKFKPSSQYDIDSLEHTRCYIKENQQVRQLFHLNLWFKYKNKSVFQFNNQIDVQLFEIFIALLHKKFHGIRVTRPFSFERKLLKNSLKYNLRQRKEKPIFLIEHEVDFNFFKKKLQLTVLQELLVHAERFYQPKTISNSNLLSGLLIKIDEQKPTRPKKIIKEAEYFNYLDLLQDQRYDKSTFINIFFNVVFVESADRYKIQVKPISRYPNMNNQKQSKIGYSQKA